MFNDDEVRSALTKMYEYSSPVDGFVEISEGLGEMIKSLANEPSVGLFYVQQHTHKAVPNLVSLRNNIVSKSREMSLHTEDSEDSITMVRSMKECGFPIVDDMIKDITKSIATISSKQPKKGLISSKPVSGSQTTRTSSWGPTTWRSMNDVEKSSSYLSSVFKSAKQKATNLKWAQLDALESKEEAIRPPSAAMQREEEELPISSHIASGNQEDVRVDELISNLSLAENFDEFKADKEAKLEEWLGGSIMNNNSKHDELGAE
ncbi:uncharacterized protein LOC112525553 [Cynara cardunculus var. scolymus]|uniref:Uncharacterized protein family UPF0402 n=1 Tax=Cynara cardunculus var. scolymus TaxID=59895 RepID=A0A118K2X7_CYNCS|nr:uncharacterized protein LOC112525553 [Cynara cardunculus var. scolymus]KVI05042.1 Uncharacterized protein family UPF0402 [Cynara cardunculus var. scolymus]